MRKNGFAGLLAVLMAFTLTVGCYSESNDNMPAVATSVEAETTVVVETTTREDKITSDEDGTYSEESLSESLVETSEETTETTTSVTTQKPEPVAKFDIEKIPQYSGSPYVAVNGNKPYFTYDEITSDSFERYADLDRLGRCGFTIASVGKDIMPTEERGTIGSVKPTGWHTVKYDFVDGKYLYNRCHLLGYQLTGENANVKNLITGTRYLNIQGMLPFENMVADFVKETGNHVMYRVTPVFRGDNLLADGVLMEGYSVEDKGEGIEFCVFAYNVQPKVIIDYSNGESYTKEVTTTVATTKPKPVVTTAATTKPKPAVTTAATTKPKPAVTTAATTKPKPAVTTAATTKPKPAVTTAATTKPKPATTTHHHITVPPETKGATYIVNKNTKKFHNPGCRSVNRMSEKNKIYYTGNRRDLINAGYSPCGICNP